MRRTDRFRKAWSCASPPSGVRLQRRVVVPQRRAVHSTPPLGKWEVLTVRCVSVPAGTDNPLNNEEPDQYLHQQACAGVWCSLADTHARLVTRNKSSSLQVLAAMDVQAVKKDHVVCASRLLDLAGTRRSSRACIFTSASGPVTCPRLHSLHSIRLRPCSDRCHHRGV